MISSNTLICSYGYVNFSYVSKKSTTQRMCRTEGTQNVITKDNHNSNNNQRQILKRLVEEYLLTPHYTSTYIFHPKYLYPVLDDESRIIPDVRRLYTMSKRVIPTITHNNNHNSMHTTTTAAPIFTTGTDYLRMAFRAYGKERGLNLVQMKNNTHTHIKNLLEEVVNSGIEDDYDEEDNPSISTRRRRFRNNNTSQNYQNQQQETGGDGGKLVTELLAKYIDLRFSNNNTTTTTSSLLASIGANNNHTNNIWTSSSNSSQSTMEEFQSQGLDLFQYVHEKDVFEDFYKRD